MNKYYNINVINVGVNMEDEELVKRRETILFFLTVVINGIT